MITEAKVDSKYYCNPRLISLLRCFTHPKVIVEKFNVFASFFWVCCVFLCVVFWWRKLSLVFFFFGLCGSFFGLWDIFAFFVGSMPCFNRAFPCICSLFYTNDL